MKKNFFYLIAGAVLLTACGGQKRMVEVSRDKGTSLEGDRVVIETRKMQGIEMAESLNEEGTGKIQRPFKWFAGIYAADDKQLAVESAQREAYSTISRVFQNIVKDQAERGNVANNGRVQRALTSHWEQVSMSVEKACEPFGAAVIEYNPATRMYSVTAKVGVRGDRFNQLLNSAGNFKPESLSGEELDRFIETNKSIMEAAKGN